MPTTLLLASANVTLTDLQYDEIANRLNSRATDGDGLAAAALDALRHPRPLNDRDKRAIFDAADAWFAETDIQMVGPEIVELRHLIATELSLGTIRP